MRASCVTLTERSGKATTLVVRWIPPREPDHASSLVTPAPSRYLAHHAAQGVTLCLSLLAAQLLEAVRT